MFFAFFSDRFKDGDPERIYPRSSFSINCKGVVLLGNKLYLPAWQNYLGKWSYSLNAGDVCRGDAVLFKQKVYEKR